MTFQRNLFITLFFCCLNLSYGETIIEGTVINGPTQGQVELHAFHDFFSWSSEPLAITDLEYSQFELRSDISETSLFRLVLNGKSFDLFLSPNQTYKLELRPSGLKVLRESEDLLNGKIKSFENLLRETDPGVSNHNRLIGKVQSIRDQVIKDDNLFFKNYCLTRILQRESLLRALMRDSDRHQLLTYQTNRINPLLMNLDLKNPQSAHLISEYATNLLAIHKSEDPQCISDVRCSLRVVDSILDPRIRDLVAIRIIQNENNSREKRDLDLAKSLLERYLDSKDEIVRSIAQNVLTWIANFERS